MGRNRSKKHNNNNNDEGNPLKIRHPNRHPKNEKNDGGGRVVKEKFQEERIRSIIPLTAKNDNQKTALNMFKTKQLVGLFGSSGVGKTELAVWWACKLWLEGRIDNIVISRPYKHLGADYGATKGNDAEKLLPFCMSMLMKMKKYLGVGILRNNFKIDGFEELFSDADGIQIVPVEKIQGMSFNERTILLCDELQNCTIAQVKAVTTRLEEGCQLILCGDDKQTALSSKNGLTYLMEVLNKNPHYLAGYVKFTPEDSCREGITAHLTKIFEEDGNW